MFDAVFGGIEGQRINHDGRQYICWAADAAFSYDQSPISVRVFGSEAGPSSAQRTFFAEFRERYPELRAAMQSALAQQYDQLRSEWGWSPHALNDASEIWQRVSLRAVEVCDESTSGAQLVVCHELREDPEHDLNVAIKDWRILEVMLEG
jgi:hypothetical protein